MKRLLASLLLPVLQLILCPAAVHAQAASWDGLEPAARYAVARLRNQEARNPFPGDNQARMVFISASNGRAPAQVAVGRGNAWAGAIDDAQRNLKGAAADWIRIDFVVATRPLGKLQPGRNIPMDFGLEALHLSGIGWFFSSQQLVHARAVTEDNTIFWKGVLDAYQADCASRNVQADLESFVQAEAHALRVVSFCADSQSLLPIYRDHARVSELTRDSLLSAARAGGEYLIRATRDDGKFDYTYVSSTDAIDETYNTVRHAGTIYSMLELYEVTRDPKLLESAKRAMAWMRQRFRPMQYHGLDILAYEEDNEVKLGGNALAIVALAKYISVVGDREPLKDIERLERFVLAVQQPSGRFQPHTVIFSDGRASPFVSEYYPGEALLALTRTNAIAPEPARVDAAEKGAQWLINVRDIGLRPNELQADHWLLYALDDLYRERPKPVYLDHAMKIAEGMIGSQVLESPYEDHVGSWLKPPPRATPASTRNEGLIRAYRLARDFNRPDDARAIHATLERGMKFQMQCQLGAAALMLHPNPPRALGAVRGSLFDDEVRIDYVQHFISAQLGMAEILNH